MLIAFLIFVFFVVLGLVLVSSMAGGFMTGNAGREALRKENQELKEKLARTAGMLETLSDSYQRMTEIASNALEVAKQKHFPQKVISTEQHEQLESQFDFETVRPTYQPPEVRFCDSCNVSVRSETWPVKCPNENCSAWIGDEWPGEIKL